MLFTFTKREIQVLKKILPTVKLSAYDIQTYQGILHSLNNPYDQPTSKKSDIPKPDTIKTNRKVIMDEPEDYLGDEPKPKSKIIKHTPSSQVIVKSVEPPSNKEYNNTTESMFK